MIPGIDVSFWQGVVDWDKAASRVEFAFLRAGQNMSIDSWFIENWQKSSGKLPRGAYWFYDWRSGKASAAEHGDLFGSVIGGAELPAVMDFENPYQGWSDTPFPGKTASVDIMRRFQDAAQIERPILYTNAATLRAWGTLPADITDNWYLWVAAWPTILRNGKWDAVRSFDEIPANWTPATYGWPYTFWQYTCKLDGKAHGMTGLDLDGDVFNGTADEFAAFIGADVPPITDPEPPPPFDNSADQHMARIAAQLRRLHS